MEASGVAANGDHHIMIMKQLLQAIHNNTILTARPQATMARYYVIAHMSSWIFIKILIYSLPADSIQQNVVRRYWVRL